MNALPVWNALKEQFAGRVDVRGLVLCGTDAPQEAAEHAAELGTQIETLYDPEHAVYSAWGLSGEPEILLLDRSGAVIRNYDWIRLLTVDDRDGRRESSEVAQMRRVVQAKLSADLERACAR